MNYDILNVFSIFEDYYIIKGPDPQQDSGMLSFHGHDGVTLG